MNAFQPAESIIESFILNLTNGNATYEQIDELGNLIEELMFLAYEYEINDPFEIWNII
jgi:hypothetical protein